MLNLFRSSLIQVKPVCDAFLDFQTRSPYSFFEIVVISFA